MTEQTSLINKVLNTAQDVIRCQEGSPAIIDHWNCLSARSHEVIISVVLAMDKGNQMFTVWVVANLDTEEVYCM